MIFLRNWEPLKIQLHIKRDQIIRFNRQFLVKLLDGINIVFE